MTPVARLSFRLTGIVIISGHVAMREHPELFARELRAAFRSLRGA